MHFLVDANLPRRAVEVLRECGHAAQSIRDVGLGAAPDNVIAACARENEWRIITRDAGFGDIRSYPPELFPGLVVVSLPNTASVALIVDTIRRFLDNPSVIANLAGNLAVITADRIRMRHGKRCK